MRTMAVPRVVGGHLDLGRPVLGPGEADPVLVVDADAVLPVPISLERLQAVAGRDLEVGESGGGVELIEPPPRDPPEVHRQELPRRFLRLAVEEVFEPGVAEGEDQG